MVTGAAWLWAAATGGSLWDVGGIGWRIQEGLGGEEAPWPVEIKMEGAGCNGTGSVGRSHVRLCGCWKLPVVLGGAGWPKGSLLPTEETTMILQVTSLTLCRGHCCPPEPEQPLGVGSLGKSRSRQFRKSMENVLVLKPVPQPLAWLEQPCSNLASNPCK